MRPPTRPLILLALPLAAALWAVVAGRREARLPPEIAHYHMTAAPTNCPQHRLRIAVAGDLHVSAVTPPAAVAETVRRINAERPDYVLMVGDFLGHGWPTDPASVRRALAPLTGLRPRVGTATVLGNNDTLDGIGPIAAALRAAGVRVLWNNAWITPDLTVFGVADLTTNDANPRQAIDRYRARMRGRPGPPLAFWLAHQPEMLDRLPATGALLFTGHTHGGQVWPGITVPLARFLVAGAHALRWSAYWPTERYVRGYYRRGPKRMIVTSGVGVSDLPLRLGVPPEVVVLDVAPCRPLPLLSPA